MRLNVQIYLIAFSVLALSFGAASLFPAGDMLKGVVASPGIAALFAVLYEALKSASEEQRQRRSWLLTNKLRIYSSIHVAIGEVLQALQDLAEREIVHPSRKENIENYFSALDKLRPRMNEAIILCDSKVKGAMESLNNHTNQLTHNLLEQSFWPKPEVAAKTKDWEPRNQLMGAADSLLSEMRRELGAKKLPE